MKYFTNKNFLLWCFHCSARVRPKQPAAPPLPSRKHLFDGLILKNLFLGLCKGHFWQQADQSGAPSREGKGRTPCPPRYFHGMQAMLYIWKYCSQEEERCSESLILIGISFIYCCCYWRSTLHVSCSFPQQWQGATDQRTNSPAKRHKCCKGVLGNSLNFQIYDVYDFMLLLTGLSGSGILFRASQKITAGSCCVGTGPSARGSCSHSMKEGWMDTRTPSHCVHGQGQESTHTLAVLPSHPGLDQEYCW